MKRTEMKAGEMYLGTGYRMRALVVLDSKRTWRTSGRRSTPPDAPYSAQYGVTKYDRPGRHGGFMSYRAGILVVRAYEKDAERLAELSHAQKLGSLLTKDPDKLDTLELPEWVSLDVVFPRDIIGPWYEALRAEKARERKRNEENVAWRAAERKAHERYTAARARAPEHLRFHTLLTGGSWGKSVRDRVEITLSLTEYEELAEFLALRSMGES